MSHDVFISHSSIDKNIADAVTAALEQSQIRCWIAPRDILPGESWGGSIVDAIEASKVMVMVFSSNSNDSKQVMREVERAVQKDVVVVPFRVEAVEPSRDMEYFLSATHWLDAVTPEMDDHLQDLVGTVQALLNKSEEGAPVAAKAKSKKAQAKPAVTLKPAKKGGGLKWVAMLGGIAVLALGAWLFLGGESEQSTSTGSKTEDKVLAKDLGERGEGSIKLKAPSSAEAGQKITVAWSGKSASNDQILISKSDAQDSVALQYTAVGSGKEAELQMPGNPGNYEIRYRNGADRKVIARSDIEINKPEVTLSAPSELQPGSEINVDWTAPNYKSDYLAIAEANSEGNSYITYSYTRAGSPTKIRVPDVAGKYELRYISALDKAIWAAEEVTVNEPVAKVALPESVGAGAKVAVQWEGPANKGDYLSVGLASDDPGQYVNYVYVKAGKKALLSMPEEAGEFEVRYMSGLSKQVWATQMVNVTMPEVSIQAPASAAAGHEIEVPWQGPANQRDYLAVAESGSEANSYTHYKYVKKGQKIKLIMPDSPGQYVLRYISGGKKQIWAESPITIAPRSESLDVPESVAVGGKFNVEWQEKGHAREYVAIYEKGADVGSYQSYKYTKNKTKVTMTAPKEPGEYEVRYISGQEKLVWASAPITVE